MKQQSLMGAVVVWLATMMLVGCMSVGERVTPTASAPPTLAPTRTVAPASGCGAAPLSAPGTSRDITINMLPASAKGQTTRTFRVHTPATYRANVAQPVVLAYHGYGGNAVGLEAGMGLSALSDARGFIAVYPQGLPDGEGVPFWASAGPIDYAIDEVAFTNAVLDRVQVGYCVDPMRIFATGFSNGGAMANYLACHLAERIAAVAPISGNYYFWTKCQPARAIAVLEVHGVQDGVVPYHGDGPGAGLWRLPDIPQYLADWAARDGCTAGPATLSHTPDVTELAWTACHGNATVRHYRLEQGGHSIPTTVNGQSFVALLWQFFAAHPLG